ncbi:MAG: histidine kinase N-terminal 7TM domain-containing protein [Dehalococcoidia bacterium]
MNEAYFFFYQSAMGLSLVVSLFVIALTWRHRRTNGAKPMIALAAATFVWTLGYLFEANSDTLERQILFTSIAYLGSMSVPVALFVFAVNYTSGGQLLVGWKIVPFCIIPLVAVTLVWTNDWHHLMWFNEHLTRSGPFVVTAKSYGTFFWIAVGYGYILAIAAAIILLRRLFVGVPLYKGQAISLIVAVSLPLIWNFIYIFGLDRGLMPHKDLTPVMFAISGAAIVLGLMRFQLFRTVPFARKFLIHQLGDGILVFDKENRLVEANPAALKILGMDRNIIGKGIDQLRLSSPMLGLSSTESGSVELQLTVSGEDRIYELETTAMRDNRDRLVGWVNILHDITKRKQAEEALQQYKRAIECSTDMITAVDRDCRYIFANRAFLEYHRMNQNDVVGHTVEEVVGKETFESTVKEHVVRCLNGENVHYEMRYEFPEMGTRYLEVLYYPLDMKGPKATGAVAMIRDITERKQAEQQIRHALEEKETLLREIHHRVKNNLQIVSSLLRRQGRQVQDDTLKQTLKESENRVLSMSLIHEKLYHSEDLANINFQEFIRTISRSLVRSFGTANVTLKPDIEDIQLPVDTAIPCGMIVNELVSNALKYAFPEGQEGEVEIALHRIGDSEVELMVRDNGVGMPEDIDIRNTDTLGMDLVVMLAEKQLDGKLELDKSEGTEFRIRFPVP